MYISMYFFVSLLSSDTPKLGRPEIHLLSQQTLMELLIADTGNNSLITQNSQSPVDISKWIGVTLNDSNEVTEIGWTGAGLVGTFAFQYLPPTIHTIRLTRQKHITGTIDLALLPPSITLIDFAGNFFDGELHLSDLPPKIQTFSIFENKLIGSLDLKRLPESLEWMDLSSNSFSGEICLTQLPRRMEYLCLEKNSLSGSVDLTALPRTLNVLKLAANGFEGETDFSKLPESLSIFHVSDTNLEGTIHMRGEAHDFWAKNSKVRVNAG
mmetsp:Transcript_24785/g.38614  ORF Transcript_24785/g.38614 Transcript_24785/m.38614 type:complete len:268 (-) Transcript_24785:64-867(-)